MTPPRRYRFPGCLLPLLLLLLMPAVLHAQPDSASLAGIREHMAELDGPKELLIYCDASCDSDEVLARRIISMGYDRNVYVLDEGLPAWKVGGNPVRKTEETNVEEK